MRKRVDAAGPASAASVPASPPAPGRLAPQGGLSVRVQLGQSGYCIRRGGSLISRLQCWTDSRPRQTRMQTSNRFFDDLAKVASGAASTLVGVKQEIEALVRQRSNAWLRSSTWFVATSSKRSRRWRPMPAPSRSGWNSASQSWRRNSPAARRARTSRHPTPSRRRVSSGRPASRRRRAICADMPGAPSTRGLHVLCASGNLVFVLRQEPAPTCRERMRAWDARRNPSEQQISPCVRRGQS